MVVEYEGIYIGESFVAKKQKRNQQSDDIIIRIQAKEDARHILQSEMMHNDFLV